MIKSAVISECGKYRYELHRTWDESRPKVLFVMLNPSTADAELDDPTIRRCIGFAKTWGYGGIMVGNMFAYRATDPNELKNMPVDPEVNDINHQVLMKMHWAAKETVFAFGNPPVYRNLPMNGMNRTYHLGLTKAGNPKHPLYLKGDTQMQEFEHKKIFG